MPATHKIDDSADGRLAEQYPPLTNQEALVEANRCLFCFDAPCTHACPTHIDIPAFIKKISTGNLLGSARTILDANLLGATCARVCPVQELCEGACVLGAEHKPIMIGRLQRHSMDHLYRRGPSALRDTLRPAASTGKKIAVIGSGPAGLSCAGQLARAGHAVTVFEKRDLGGGLSTYGIIALREPAEIALAEVEMIGSLGVQFQTGKELGGNLAFGELQRDFDAIFLSTGLGHTPPLGIVGEEYLVDGLAYVEQSKLDAAALHVGRRAIVIGAGNTAIDCATIAKRLGAERVTIVYRRTDREMSAYVHEYDFARHEGIEFRFLMQPTRVVVDQGQVKGLECVLMRLGKPDESARPAPEPLAGSEFILEADQIVKAVGQEKPALAAALGLHTQKGYLQVSDSFETNIPGVYAGGDCIRSKGSASTVMAVQDGKQAALAIDRELMNANGGSQD